MEIREIAINRAQNLYGKEISANISNRIERELEFIKYKGYENIFISTAKIVNYFKAMGKIVIAKGRIGGSLIAYLLGISDVNPIEPHYICNNCKCVNFPDNKKYYTAYDLEDMTCPKCGNKMEKQGYGIPLEILFGLNGERDIDFAINVSFDVLELNTAELIQQSTGAAAVFNADLRQEKNGIYIVSNNTAINNIYNNSFKINVTSSAILEVLKRCIDETKVNIDEISFYDDKIYSIFREGDTLGLDFFGNERVKEIMNCVKPKCFSDLVRIMHLAYSIDLWDDNSKELFEIKELPLSKESIMLYLIEKGLSKEEAYGIINNIGLKKSITKADEDTMRNHKISEEYIQCLKKVKYLMPKAHTVADCKVLYCLAYFKVYYNDVFNNVCDKYLPY